MLRRRTERGAKLAQAFQQRWRFGIVEGKIAMLTIMPEPLPALPAPVAAYINSTNACDLPALLSTFADDALVNDQLARIDDESHRQPLRFAVIGVKRCEFLR